MPVEYLLCIDFEATCFPFRNTRNWFAEIIEFPAVILNLQTGQWEDTFHYYVRPTEFPILSNGCIAKTHINQIEVDGADDLEDVIYDFDSWTQEMCDDRGVVMPTSTDLCPDTDYMVICTWSHSDMRNFLANECYYKNIIIPETMQYWFDAQAAAVVHGFSPQFDRAMSQLRIRRIGRPHCGLDDSYSLTRVAFKLYQQFGENFEELEEM